MKLRYDSKLKIAGIGIVAWSRLGPERWFENYSIASMGNWDLPVDDALPRVFSRPDGSPKLAKLNTYQLLRDPSFQKLLNNGLAGYDLLTYKPVLPPIELASRRFLAGDKSVATNYENKVFFRQKFADKLDFPAFEIMPLSQLPTEEAGYASLMGGRQTIVIQDEQLSGGKGSFVVSSFEDYQAATALLGQVSTSSRVVVSDFVVSARERSIQGCVTASGIYSGPLQRQIVRNPLLANVASPSGDKFCGAQISRSDQGTPLHKQAQHAAEVVGRQLSEEGYRGIFGLDFLVDENKRLYTIEVNPRITGVTPLLTALADDDSVPFYLLHILELGGYDYDIVDGLCKFSQQGSLLVLHSLVNTEVVIDSMPQSGTYALSHGKLNLVSRNVSLEAIESDQFIFQAYAHAGSIIGPGGRLATLQTKQLVIDDKTDKLYNTTVLTLAALRSAIVTHPNTL